LRTGGNSPAITTDAGETLLGMSQELVSRNQKEKKIRVRRKREPEGKRGST